MGRRVLIFFAYMFGFVVGLPALVLFLVEREVGSLQWPPPPAFAFDPAWTVESGRFPQAARLLAAEREAVDLRPVLPDARAAAAAVNPDGTLAAAARFGRAGAAEAAAGLLAAQYGVIRREPGPAGDRIATRDGMAGLLLRDPTRLLVVLGLDEAAARRRLAAMPGLGLVRNPAAARVAGRPVLAAALAGVLGWAVLQVFLFGRVAAWAGQAAPRAGVPPVLAMALEQRLFALNAQDLPFRVWRGAVPGELVVEWRYADAKWFDLMRLHGLKRTFRLTLRLDDAAKVVRAMDASAALDWSAGPGDARLAYRASRGITFFEYQRGGVLGLQIRNGRLTLDSVYTWRFNLAELRGPVVAIVTEAGWRYRPVITFFRPVGG